jgi:hypothetical protein
MGENMLTKLIVASYVWLLEIALWLTLALAGVVGYHVTVPMMNSAGAVFANEFTWKILGALVFPIIALLVLAVITGPILVLVDLRNAVKNIETRLERGNDVGNLLHLEHREPFL